MLSQRNPWITLLVKLPIHVKYPGGFNQLISIRAQCFVIRAYIQVTVLFTGADGSPYVRCVACRQITVSIAERHSYSRERHAEPRRVFEFLNYSLCDGMFPVTCRGTSIICTSECAPSLLDLTVRIELHSPSPVPFKNTPGSMLASLERRSLESDTNECRPKFFIDRVETAVMVDFLLDIAFEQLKITSVHSVVI